MANNKIKVATCQFAVGGSIKRNSKRIQEFMRRAGKGREDIVHFPECALSGYARIDHESFEGFDWETLRSETENILALAAKLKLWVILGSAHPLTGRHKPHNCLYLIGPRGNIVDRYDKRFCLKRDLVHYSSGDHFVFFEINGVKCSLLICHDIRFPELYRELKRKKVDCVFQSYYIARETQRSVNTDIVRQSMQCRARAIISGSA